MLIFNCTKAAAEFFTVTRKGEKISPLSSSPTESPLESGTPLAPISQWLVHLKRVNRKPVLIAMHVHTRYAMVFCHLKKGDWAEFTTLFIERLFNNLHLFMETFEWGDEESFKQMLDRFLEQHPRPYFCVRGDRSVQSHINEVAWQFEDQVYEMGGLPETQEQASTFDEWCNSLLKSTRQQPDHFYPDEEMFIEWVSAYGLLHASEHDLIRPFFHSLRIESFDQITDPDMIAEIQAEMDATIERLSEKAPISPSELPDNVIDFLSARANKK